jgi:hypothetical protein
MGVSDAFPLSRDSWTFSALWNHCFEIFTREWLMLSVGVLVVFGIGFAAQLVASILPALAAGNQVLQVFLTVVAMVANQCVQGVLWLGFLRMLMQMLQGGTADIGLLFSQLHKVGTYLLTLLLIFLVLIVPIGVIAGAIGFAAARSDSVGAVLVVVAVVLVIPLIYFLMPLYLLLPEIAHNDRASPLKALRNCYAYARGERLSIFGVGLVGGLVTLAGVLACCVGALPALGLSYLLMTGLYLALRNGADVQE